MRTKRSLALLFILLIAGRSFGQTNGHTTPVVDIDNTWQQNVISLIGQSEYNISYDEQKQAYQSPNRKQNLRAYYSENGCKIQQRVTEGSEWFVEWGNTQLYRRNNNKLPYATAGLKKLDQNRISFTDGKNITAEYINLENGVKSNYILDTRPQGDGPLHLQLDIKTNLHAEMQDSKIIFFEKDIHDAQLHYGDLYVYDSNGKEIPSSMQYNSATSVFTITVDDIHAVYPLTIDPLALSPQLSIEPNSSDAYFGWAVKGAGDINGDGYDDVIVGAQRYDNGSTDEGRAFLYLGGATGLSTTASWTAESDQAAAYFGICVAAAGDVNNDGFDDVLVSAYYYDGGSTDEGRAYLYSGSATGLSVAPAWTAESNQTGAHFGSNLAGGGDINNDGYSDVLISASHYDGGNTDEGRLYLYAGGPSGLGISPIWSFETNQNSAVMNAMDFLGDVNGDGFEDVAAGAYLFDNGSTDEGKIWVFYNTATGLPLLPSWSYEVNKINTKLGNMVSAAGDVNGDGYADLLAGAYEYDIGSLDNDGRAYFFKGSASGFSLTPDWEFTDTYYGGKCGSLVSDLGDLNKDGFGDFLITQPNFDDGSSGFAHKGRVFVFYGSAEGPAALADWIFIGTSGAVEAGSGYGAGYIGDVNNDGYNEIIIGSWSYGGGEIDEGRIQLFYGSPEYPLLSPSDTILGTIASSTFGWNVELLEDVNNDGFSDLCVSAPFFDNGSTDEGKVFGFWGNAAGFALTPSWSAEGNQDNANFGYSIDAIEDYNHDGYSDLVIGAPGFDFNYLDEGRVFIYKGTASGLNYLPSKVYNGNQLSAKLGYRVAGAGDINGDGFDDILSSAPYYDGGLVNEGLVNLYTGAAVTLSSTPFKSISGLQSDALFGSALNGTGDINNDGFDDFIIGSPLFDNAFTNAGKAIVYQGASAATGITATHTYEGAQASAQMGFSANGAGDINGDGYTEILIGTPYFDLGLADQGRVSLAYGSAAGIGDITWEQYGFFGNSQLGFAVNTAGDINGDGYGDIAVAGVFDEFLVADEGLVNVYYGSLFGPGSFPGFAARAGQTNSQLGFSIDAADVNGDSFSDLIAGAPYYDATLTDRGAAFLYLGTADTCEGDLIISLSSDTASITAAITSTIPALLRFDYRYRQEGTAAWTTGSTGSNSFMISGLANCTVYEVEVQAVCASGSGSWISLTDTTDGCISDCSAVIITGLTVINTSDTTITANWDAVADVEEYLVQYRITGSPVWTSLSVSEASVPLELAACSEYEIQVRADCAVPGAWSPIVPFITSVCLEPCAFAPDGLYADGITSASASLHWNPVYGAIKYKVYYRIVGGSWTIVNSLTNSKNISGLSAGASYQFKVKAICSGLSGSFSALSSFSTPARLGVFNGEVTVYPNPNTGDFTITLLQMQNQYADIIIRNISGQLIAEQQLLITDNAYNFSMHINTTPGIYEISIIRPDADPVIKQIIIN